MAIKSTSVLGISKKDDMSITSGFKTAYANADGSYTVEFNNGTKVETMPIKGDKGDKGEAFKYEDFTPEQLADLKGDQGDKGDRGATGVGVVSVVKTGESGLVDFYTMTFSDGSETVFPVVNGANVKRLSQLENDENFITITVNNLVNYYTKNDVYNKSKIDELLRNIGAGLAVVIVTELPTEEISGTTIYLVKASGNNYNQYMYIDGEWANLGSTNIDLSNYYTKEQVDNLLLTYIDADTLAIILEGYVKKSDLGKVATSNDYNDLDNLPEIPSTEGFMKGRQNLGEADLNDCRTEGTFTVSANSANLPSIEIYGTFVDLQVLNIETVVSQIVRLIHKGEPMMWSRCWIVDHWTEWVHAISSDMATDELVDSSKSIATSKALFGVAKKVNKNTEDIAKNVEDIDDLNDSLVDKEPLHKRITNPTPKDLNALIEEGTYTIGVLGEYKNQPKDVGSYGNLIVTVGGAYITQEWIPGNNGSGSAWRNCENGGTNWSDWHYVATMDKMKDGYAKIIKNSDTDTDDAMFIAYKNSDLFGVRIYKNDDSEHELKFSASGISYVKNGVTIWTK